MDANLFLRYQAPIASKVTERGEQLTEFTNTINADRRGTKYKPVTIARIGALVAHIETKDLYYLLSVCRDAGRRGSSYNRSFAMKFFYELKPHAHEPTTVSRR